MTTTIPKATHSRSATVAVIPSWVIPTGKPDGMDFFAAIALAGLENVWIRLSAADQRALVGYKAFGNRAIKSDGSSVEAFRSVCFGTDGDIQHFSAADLTARVVK
jgi:hypothetical protein